MCMKLVLALCCMPCLCLVQVSLKLYEKHRGKARVQDNNANTFQFT